MESVGLTLEGQRLLSGLRRRLRTSEAVLMLVAISVGCLAGGIAALIGTIAKLMHQVLYGIGEGMTLSSLSTIDVHLLFALPAGGLVLGFASVLTLQKYRVSVDVIEANALHGGRIPIADTLAVVGETLVSNGFGASVGLEAAYAQAGGGLASLIGQWLNLRRGDMRMLVGAGAGAAIGAAFGAPLAGAFYAFEIVIGAYTPASIAVVAAASVAAALTSGMLGAESYLLVSSAAKSATVEDYALYGVLGVVCAGLGIGLMWGVSLVDWTLRRSPLPDFLRPFFGGLLLIPIAFASPHTLSAGHGALHLTIATQLALSSLVLAFCLKSLASIISLGFGFRGGLFFAALYLGALTGQIFSALLVLLPGVHEGPLVNAALVGMAGFAVAVVGGPMTMTLLVLEQTRDFGITAMVLTAALVSSSVAREWFGYSFSTWRLHLRGEAIRSARDIGWMRSLTARALMRKAPASASADMTIETFRNLYPLGSTSRVVLTDATGRYCGIVPTPTAYIETGLTSRKVSDLAIQTTETLKPDADIETVLRRFEDVGADDLAVIEDDGTVAGLLTEKYVRKRFADEIERNHLDLFGEGRPANDGRRALGVD